MLCLLSYKSFGGARFILLVRFVAVAGTFYLRIVSFRVRENGFCKNSAHIIVALVLLS